MYHLIVNKKVHLAVRIACTAVAVVMLLGVVGLMAKADWLFGFVNAFLATPSSMLHLNKVLLSFSQNFIVVFGLLFYFSVAFITGLGIVTINTNSNEGI